MENVKIREGIVYAIKSNKINKIYIGSSFNFSSRKSSHKNIHNKCTSAIIIKQDDYKFVILEKVNCKEKHELLKREGHHQLNYYGNYKLVNKMIAGRTMSEYRHHKKNYLNEKIKCPDCCGKYTRTNYSHHIKSKMHMEKNKINLL